MAGPPSQACYRGVPSDNHGEQGVQEGKRQQTAQLAGYLTEHGEGKGADGANAARCAAVLVFGYL